MRRMRRRAAGGCRWASARLGLVIAISAGACASGTAAPAPTQESVTRATVPPRVYTEADLPSLVLQESDVPAGTEYWVHPFAFEDIARTATLSKGFRKGGFVAAYGSGFASPEDTEDIGVVSGPNAVSVVILFETEEGASSAVRLIRDDLRGMLRYSTAPIEELSPASLGEEALGLQQVEAFNGPVLAYFWRVGNVMMMCSSGAIDRAEFDALAEAMDPQE